MFNSLAVSWALTAVLLVCGSYHFLQTIRPHQLPGRVNNGLHGLMHVLMAAMLWNLAPATRLAQVFVLAGAALWFITQAVARPDIKILCAHGLGRLKCFYHGSAMAGAAVMVIMMDGMTAGHDIVPSDGMAGMPGMRDHHPVAAATPVHLPNVAFLLTVFFAAAAVVFVIALLRFLPTRTSFPHASIPRLAARAEQSIEALGAAVMALMFATMAA